MDKSDKPQSVAGETNNTTLTVKRRGRRRHDEAVAGVNAEGVVPSEASAVSASGEVTVHVKRGRKKAVFDESVTPEGVAVKVKSSRGRKPKLATGGQETVASVSGRIARPRKRRC